MITPPPTPPPGPPSRADGKRNVLAFDLQDFYNDGDSNGAGATTVDFAQGTPSGGMVTVPATISGTVIPEKLFVDVEVTQSP